MQLHYSIVMNLISENQKYKTLLLNNFIRYVKIWSESSGEQAEKGVFPSTPQQWDMANTLKDELTALGMQNVTVTDKCYVYANYPASDDMQNSDSVLFLAHMDTVDEVSGKNVNPQIINDGTNFTKDKTDTIITTDKKTLLGGDDKAGIAAIMTALAYITSEKCSHSAVEVIFSPDEETGHGMDFVPTELIKSKYAYTVDGGDLGEMETECFNAWSATVNFTGKACHTGYAKKGDMINANLMLASFLSKLPVNKMPQTTEGFEGFIAPMESSATIESGTLNLLLRSFSNTEIDEEKNIIMKLADKVKDETGGIVTVTFKQQYLNMKEKLDENPRVVERVVKAFKEANVNVVNSPIRGGTDGSRLTEMGIPTPNIFTGSHEFHSRNEWCSLNQMAKASDIILNILFDK